MDYPESKSFFGGKGREAEEPLLEDPEPLLRQRRSSVFYIQWLYNIFSMVAILSMLCGMLWPRRHCFREPQSPMDHIISYERQRIYPAEHEGYSGESSEADAKWERLVDFINIKATREDYQRAQVEITDELVETVDGFYSGVPAIMHDLHCLNSLRKLVHKPYHYPNMSAAVSEIAVSHADHCLDVLRRSLMCKPDISLLGGYWIADQATHPNVETGTQGERTCVNWNAIVEWLRPRSLARHEYAVKPGPFETEESLERMVSRPNMSPQGQGPVVS